MPEKPIPQLRQALTELLEQKVTVPSIGDARFSHERGPQWDKDKSMFTMVIGDDGKASLKRPPKTHLKNPLTMRQLLSAIAYREGDYFVLESSRQRHRDTPEYRELLDENPKLRKYIRFFDTVTSIVDRNELPAGVTVEEVPAIMRAGVGAFKDTLAGHQYYMEENIQYRGNRKKLEDTVFFNKTKFLLLGLQNDDWVPAPLKERLDYYRVVNQAEIERSRSENREENQDVINLRFELMHDLGSYMAQHKMFDLEQCVKEQAEKRENIAQSQEDLYALFTKTRSALCTALEKGGINLRSSGNPPLSP